MRSINSRRSGPSALGLMIDARWPTPQMPASRRQRPEVRKRVGIDVGRLGEDVFGKCRHTGHVGGACRASYRSFAIFTPVGLRPVPDQFLAPHQRLGDARTDMPLPASTCSRWISSCRHGCRCRSNRSPMFAPRSGGES